MIGGWDETSCELALFYNAWSKGNGTADKNAGNMPSYPAGAHQNCAFTNMGVGKGYLYNAGDGNCDFDNVDDFQATALTLAFTNASKFTIEVISKFASGASRGVFGLADDANNLFSGTETSTLKLNMAFEKGGVTDQVQTNATLINGQTYHYAFVKDGATLKLYINGVENGGAGYQIQNPYNLGNFNPADTLDVGAGRTSAGAVRYRSQPIYLFAYYSDALTVARILTNAGLGYNYGLVGTNVGDTMSVSAPGGAQFFFFD